jgi:hypothetical protein
LWKGGIKRVKAMTWGMEKKPQIRGKHGRIVQKKRRKEVHRFSSRPPVDNDVNGTFHKRLACA